ncbi:MAG: ABC transporter ATP-binding protein/permease [Ignavibacteria bacterium]|nr:ABC transporter ATP-binding protein/permease [Ignavibacteria bacterium]
MKNLKRLFGILGKWKMYYVLSAILLIVSTLIRMLEPKVLQITVDKLVLLLQGTGGNIKISTDAISKYLFGLLPEMNNENVLNVLMIIGAIYLIFSFLRAGTWFVSSTITASSTENAVKKLKDDLFSHIQFLPMTYHSQISTGQLIQRCTGDVETIRKFASMQVVEALRMAVIFIGAFTMMLSINVPFAFISIGLCPFVIIGAIVFFRKEMVIWDEHEKRQDRLAVTVQENLSGIRVVKAFAKEKFEIEKFTEQNEEKRQWGFKLLKLHSYFWPYSDIVMYVQLAVCVFVGAYFTLNGKISVGELTAFNVYSLYVIWPLRRLGQLVSEMGMTSVAIDRIYSILGSELEENKGEVKESEKLKGEIVFENVSFKYDNNEKNSLENVSFRAKPGEKIALLGPTGAGKTTIISLLTRFFDIQKGKILLDGKDIKSYSKELLRKRIGVVLQKPFLFSTSIKENIAYGNRDAHSDEIIESAKAASIHGIINDIFPDAYKTVIGEKGINLSGGQKQRVTIARTLLTNPDILVLDDSTSAVDTETEYEIRSALDKIMKKKTTFIITHRINAAMTCDKIIVLNKGHIVEMGNHEQLIRNNGFYKKIHDIQVTLEEDITDEINEVKNDENDIDDFNSGKEEYEKELV